MQYLRIWPSFVLVFLVSHSLSAEEIIQTELATENQWLSVSISRDKNELGYNLNQLFVKVSHGRFYVHPVTISSYFYKMHRMRINNDLIRYQANHSTMLSIRHSTAQHFRVRQADSSNQHWITLARQRVQSLVEANFSPLTVGVTFNDGNPGLAFKNSGDKKYQAWPFRLLKKVRIDTDEVMLELGTKW